MCANSCTIVFLHKLGCKILINYLKMVTYTIHQFISGNLWTFRYYSEPKRSRVSERIKFDNYPWFAPYRKARGITFLPAVVFATGFATVSLPLVVVASAFYYKAFDINIIVLVVAFMVCATIYTLLVYFCCKEQEREVRDPDGDLFGTEKLNMMSVAVILMAQKKRVDLEVLDLWVRAAINAEAGFVFTSAYARSAYLALEPILALGYYPHYQQVLYPLAQHIEQYRPADDPNKWYMRFWIDMIAARARDYPEECAEATYAMRYESVKCFLRKYPHLARYISPYYLNPRDDEEIDEFFNEYMDYLDEAHREVLRNLLPTVNSINTTVADLEEIACTALGV